MLKQLIASVLIISCFFSKAQNISYEEDVFKKSIHGYNDSVFNNSFNVPMLFPQVFIDSLKKEEKSNKSLVGRKLFDEHFVQISENNKYKIFLDPVFDFRMGTEDKNTLYKNTRGFILNGQIGKNLVLRSEFYETQTTLPSYASDWVDTMKFIPGMIRMKPFGDNGYDYGAVFGQIIWSPLKNYSVRLGYDRFHIGNGYRSMLLSDASQPYTFLMNTYHFGKWSLSHNIASLYNPDFNDRLNIPVSESGIYQQKWFSFTYLTYSPSDWLNLALFESCVFMPKDSSGISFYPTSLIPLPLLITVSNSLGKNRHSMIGLQANAVLKNKILFYTQLAADKIDFSKIKYQQGIQGALQLGARYNFMDRGFVFGELNIATNNAYTSSSSWTAYTQHDQPLAHPTGQQFKECITGIHWQKKLLMLDLSLNYIWAGALPVTDNYFRADNYADTLFSGFYGSHNKHDRVVYMNFQIAYLINKETRFAAFARLTLRDFKGALNPTPENTLVYELGIRHIIRKQYYDFF